MAATTWIVCASLDRKKARIFECDALDNGVRFHQDFEAPAEGQRFEPTLCREIERACKAGEFEHLILCAEHELMVPIRSHLTEETRDRIIGAVEQDLYDDNETDIVPYVANFIIDAHRSESVA